VDLVDLRLQAIEVTGQEIPTRDKVSLRLNLSATWRYTDVLRAHTQLAKPADHLYRELQRVAERIDKISVLGGLGQVLNGLVQLR
jgi:regulator of protease activity HflC (stomatin/prohibitin superfamily)